MINHICLLGKLIILKESFERTEVELWLHPKTTVFFQKTFFFIFLFKTKEKQTNNKYYTYI